AVEVDWEAGSAGRAMSCAAEARAGSAAPAGSVVRAGSADRAEAVPAGSAAGAEAGRAPSRRPDQVSM
ncbi:hypothetical protein, partial [Methylobacterium oxalidis]|uniref:hypothetical protein n=1 Tax=Methylobacterium oxalidis TaxID=944322 RepID=UPI003314649B